MSSLFANCMCLALWQPGLANETSDADLLVEFEREGIAVAFDQFMGFKERMETILKRPVDLITVKQFRNP